MNFAFIKQRKRSVLLLSSVFLLFGMLSFLSYFLPKLNTIIFFILSFLALFLAIYRFRWALYLVLAELFINSMGYIFFWEAGGLKLSLRMSLWLIIMAVFLAKIILSFFQKKRQSLLKKYQALPHFYLFLLLALILIISFIFGLFKNGFADAFFDFNAWLYLALLLPLWWVYYEADDKNKFKEDLILIFLAGVIFLSFKSLLLLFFFSHSSPFFIKDIYRWTRDYYLGEATVMSGGFYRIFLQAQIFVVFAFFFSFLAFLKAKKKRERIIIGAFNISFGAVLILSFSRSFWLGALLSLCFLLVFIWKKYSFSKALRTAFDALASLILSFLLVLLLINIPLFGSQNTFGLDSLSERARLDLPESALSSRWALLEVMKNDLDASVFLGRGFGARLEYKSSDPRVLEQSIDGTYSTYAFEWGWFDICLKIGLIGAFVYAYLLFLILKDFFLKLNKENFILSGGIILSLISLIIINFFTPYLNHPLGIIFVILPILFIDSKKEKNFS